MVGNEVPEPEPIRSTVYLSWIQQLSIEREVSPTPRDLTEDQGTEQLLHNAELFIEQCKRAQNTWQRNRVKPLPQTKAQLNTGWKIKRLQEARKKREAERTQRLQEIYNQVFQTLSNE
jgi:hypothetical protein